MAINYYFPIDSYGPFISYSLISFEGLAQNFTYRGGRVGRISIPSACLSLLSHNEPPSLWYLSTIDTDNANSCHTSLVCIYDSALVCGWVMLGTEARIIIVKKSCIKLELLIASSEVEDVKRFLAYEPIIQCNSTDYIHNRH
jgi:hypothetical protein